MKKIISILCASFVCLTGNNMCVFADEEEPPINDPIVSEYLYTDVIDSELIINSSGNATGTSRIYGLASSVTQITVHQYLQKKNGSNWDTIDSWSNTKYTWRNVCSFPYTITSSGQYRIRTEADVYCGSNYETVDCNSNTVSYP